MALPNLDPQWLELRSHLEWSRGFAPVFVFFSPTGNPGSGRAYLEAALKSQLSSLHKVTPEKPEDASSLVLSALLDDGRMRDLGAAVWVELLRGETDPAWQRARSETLAVLNERRDLLEREFKRPLILVLPRAFAETAARSAPDLWSKRVLALFPEDAAVPLTAEPSLPATAPAAPRAELEEWLKAWKTQRALPDPRRASLYEGMMAADALLEAYRWTEAHEVAVGLVEVARVASDADADAPNRLRDLSISLNKLGDAESALGRLEAARDAYRESLEIFRRLHVSLGNLPQVLNDLRFMLKRLADAERNVGDIEAAALLEREAAELEARGS